MEVTKISMGYIHIKTYVEKLRSLHVLREAIKVSTAAVEEAFEFTGSIDEFTSRLQERILKVTDGAIGRAQEPGRAITEFTYPADDDPDMLIGGEDFVGRGGALFSRQCDGIRQVAAATGYVSGLGARSAVAWAQMLQPAQEPHHPA